MTPPDRAAFADALASASTETLRYTVYDWRVATEPNTGCWLWIGPMGRNGYGRGWEWNNGKPRKPMAHRLFWEKARGPIPAGMLLDHVCRVRCCVNPDHLRVVTHRQNSTENSQSITAKQAAQLECPKCGGPYTRMANGWRYCRPCKNSKELSGYAKLLRRRALAALLKGDQ